MALGIKSPPPTDFRFDVPSTGDQKEAKVLKA